MSESAASERGPDPTSERPAHRPEGSPEPDVLLDIPEVTVDEIRLVVDGLDADLSLRARLANLVQLDAGVRVHLEGVELDVTGVSAEAMLKVRLEKLVQILDRALTTIDRNPQVIEALARSAGVSLDDVNRAARTLAGETAAPVVDQRGQQVGAVGAVAGQALRSGSAEPTSAQPIRARPPQPPTGNAEQTAPGGAGGGPTPAGATVGGAAVGGPAGGGSPSGGSVGGPSGGASSGGPAGGGGAGKPAQGGTGGGESEAGGGAGKLAGGGAGGKSEAGGGGGGKPGEGGTRGAGGSQTGGGGRPEAGSGGGKPGSGGGGRPPADAGQGSRAGQPAEGERPGPSAAQLAGQAGETLRQAGRSVWEAIQSGMGQNRQQRPKR